MTDEKKAKVQKKPPPDIEIEVKIIRRQGEATIVEWIDSRQKSEAIEYRRAIVPTTSTEGGKCLSSVLDAGVPYGEDWKALSVIGLDVDKLASDLRAQGIWRREDFVQRLTEVKATVMRVYVNPLVEQWVRELLGGK